MNKRVEILPDLQGLIARAQDAILSSLATAIQERGQFTIALSGGSTPKPLYEAIGSLNLDWNKIHVFWGDERYVPSNHPDSNELMARIAWLNRVPIPQTNIHAIPTLSGNPVADANKYEQHLQEFFHCSPGTFPSLDVILLGMGDDAHTASLFPHTKALQVRDRLVTVGNKDGNPRITFTYPLINAARSVIFLAAGANKRPALSQVFAEVADDFTYPSRLIKPQGELLWLLDAAAGSQL
ncbi:6-phosphogluconolactonase [Cylindrospermopsis raciborskii S07]|uniref:6-phosphogluconolactonase n=1 Tax=Cylindrospermopsis raciborskii CS-505 TaxID=533240 RepID=A0A853M8G2_9CYAN|nr:6-phosphogluconolactonase [Cylindrospermopsis raciborskii]EFA69014.1 6-phosphogluconolactonase [Cylindrospermopsis raciborskii CS-505]OBU74999.1 6-phosphogluconolactonase [Cylindrospermopsis raciborskii CS-505]OHY41698.1 6-phosphogluconolactonase [Cylindrospermopsis raciborskii CS-508]PNK07317.1 6-phosphogluconolactonase [Cylindrospermopsis raciborskii S10]PNK10246.1 6-phosphogluconolactonase [Cylindrospermopsis raciborskii S07]